MSGLTTYPRTDGDNRIDRELQNIQLAIRDLLLNNSFTPDSLNNLLSLVDKIGWNNLTPEQRSKLYWLLKERLFSGLFDINLYQSHSVFRETAMQRKELMQRTFAIAAQEVNDNSALGEEFTQLTGFMDLQSLCHLVENPIHENRDESPFYKHLAHFKAVKTLADKAQAFPELSKEAETLANHHDNEMRAFASQYVYQIDLNRRGRLSKEDMPSLPPGLEIVDPDTIPGLAGASFYDSSGFGAAIFRSQYTGEIMLAFKGSKYKRDFFHNVAQAFGFESQQYRQAALLGRMLKKKAGLKNVTIVGHSLGGGLAAIAAATSKIRAFTFNAAGLHSKTIERYSRSKKSKLDGLITALRVENELLTIVQENKSLWKDIGLMGKIITYASPTIGTLINGIGSLVGSIPIASGDKVTLKAGTDASALGLHGMDEMLKALQLEKNLCLRGITEYFMNQT